MTLRIPGALTLLVAVFGVVSVAVAALPVVSRYSDADQVWTAATTPQPAQVNPRLDLTPILDFAPFGRAATARTATAAPSDLILQGVSVSPDSAMSRAFITGGVGDGSSYAVGDQVAAGMTLAQIATDHVTLTTQTGPQRLDFPGMSAVGGALGAPDEAEGFSTGLQNLIPVAAPVSPTMKTLRDQLKLNPQGLLAEYGITATVDGYLIEDASLLMETGLQTGDLVTQINGRAVGDIASDRAFLDEVAASGAATLVAQREGQAITLQVVLP